MKHSVVLVFCALVLLVVDDEVAAGFGGLAKLFGRSKPKLPTISYPKQMFDLPGHRPPPYNPSYGRPPPYNPSYGRPPPTYSRNPPPYPQHGGNAQPPPYGWNLGSQGNQPSYGWNVGAGHPSGGYRPSPGGYHSNQGGYNMYPQNSFPGSNSGYRSSGFGGIVPIPIPIPIGGGGFGYPGGFGHSSFGSSSHHDRGSSSSSKDKGKLVRVLAPPDGEIVGVTELPPGSQVPQWTLFAKDISKEQYKKNLIEAEN